MHRTEAPDADPNKFGVGAPGYVDPTPAPNDGTTATPEAMDSYQEELVRAVLDREPETGVSLNTAAQDELDYVAGKGQVSRVLDMLATAPLSFGSKTWTPNDTPFSYVTGVGLVQNAIPGDIYVRGVRVRLTAQVLADIGETSHAFGPNEDTYVSVNPLGAAPSLTFSAVPVGDPPPAEPAGEGFACVVVTNGASVVEVREPPRGVYLSALSNGGASRQTLARRLYCTNVDPLTDEPISGESPLEIRAVDATGVRVTGNATNMVRFTPDGTADTTRAILIDGPAGGLAIDQDLAQIIPTGNGDGLRIDTSTTRRYGLILQTFDDVGLLAVRAPLRIVPYTQQHPSAPQSGDLSGLDVSGIDRLFWYDGTRHGRVHETPSGPIIGSNADSLYTKPGAANIEETWIQRTIQIKPDDVAVFSFRGELQMADSAQNAGAPLQIRHKVYRVVNGGAPTLVYNFLAKHQSSTVGGGDYTYPIRLSDLIYQGQPGDTDVQFYYTIQQIVPVQNIATIQIQQGLVTAQLGLAAL